MKNTIQKFWKLYLIGGLLFILLVLSFILWKYYSAKNIYFSPVNSLTVELPSNIKSNNLNNLTNEQKIQLEKAIVEKIKKEKINNQDPMTIILTENGKPILTNLESFNKNTSQVKGETSGCTDTDGGKNYDVKGTVRVNGKTYEDICGSGPSLIEYWCKEDGTGAAQGYRCPSDCQLGACVSDDSSISPTSVLVPTSTPTPTPNIFLELGKGELHFYFENEAEQSYAKKNNGASLRNDADKIYEEVKKIYGQPAFPFDMSFMNASSYGFSYYNVTTNTAAFAPDNPPSQEELIYIIVSAFHDDLIAFMPWNWEQGPKQVVKTEIYKKLFDQNKTGITYETSLYELLNQPYWSYKDGRYTLGESLFVPDLLKAGFYKLYFSDNQFFLKLNKGIYVYKSGFENENFKKDVLKIADSSIKSVEGWPFNLWLTKEYPLQIDVFRSVYVLPIFTKAGSGGMNLTVRMVKIQSDDTKALVKNMPVKVTISTHENNDKILGREEKTTNEYGEVFIDTFTRIKSSAEGADSDAGYTGAVKFVFSCPSCLDLDINYPYNNGWPVFFDDFPYGLVGMVSNRTTGKIVMKAGDKTMENTLNNGLFAGDELYNYAGPVTITYYDTELDDTKGFTDTVNKYYGNYYYNLFQFPRHSANQPTQANISPTVLPSPSTSCDISNWQSDSNSKFNFSYKYPSSWTEDSNGRFDTDSLFRRSLISTNKPEEQMNPQNKISYIDIIASKTDLKTDLDYSRWFDSGTGNQQKSQVTFKGITTEKFVDDTPMPGGNYHREMYYLKKGTFYYLISIGIYTTPDVKEENEKIVKCFLENFNFSSSDGGTNSDKENNIPKDLKKCTLEIWDPKKGCDDIVNIAVCGYTKLVYDNGMSKITSDIYKNACRYCSQFDSKTGFSELRGTKFYMLGYKEGLCD